MALRAGRVAAGGGVAVGAGEAGSALPARPGRPEHLVERGALRRRRLRVRDEAQVHYAARLRRLADALAGLPLGGLEPVDADRGRLELRGAGLRVGGVDRQLVHVHLVGEVERHEREPRPQRVVDPHRRLDRAAPRRDADDLALADLEPLGVLGRELERLAAVERRAVAVRLRAGVERLEPAAGRETDRVVGVERLERRLRLDDAERRARPLDRLGPEPLVEEERAGVLLVGARPLQARGCASSRS